MLPEMFQIDGSKEKKFRMNISGLKIYGTNTDVKRFMKDKSEMKPVGFGLEKIVELYDIKYKYCYSSA